MSVKLLAEYNLRFLSLKGGCTCSSESTLVKILHCWKSRVMAHVQIVKKVCMTMKMSQSQNGTRRKRDRTLTDK